MRSLRHGGSRLDVLANWRDNRGRRVFIPLSSLKFVRPLVFWPPAVLLLVAVCASLLNFEGFLAVVSGMNDWILARFYWLFLLASFSAVLLVVVIFFAPIGKVRIGGESAKPILSRWNWFAITLCTTIATGILFWGTAEPIFHINDPPAFSGAEARSDDAARFAIVSMLMHWTITPYAIYAVPALAFALAHYNLGKSYSLSGPLSILVGRWATGRGGAFIDAVGLYALVAGVAASLGAGVMTLAGGLGAIFGLPDGPILRLGITVLIVCVFVISSVSGIQRGIKLLSDINIRFFFILAGVIFVFGPTGSIISEGVAGVGKYLAEFLPRSVGWGERAGDQWTLDWTVFYFANWLAWAPITALFLGRISIGYTVREFLLFNLAAPAAFGGLWMIIFGGAAINIDFASDASITAAVNAGGPEAAIYAVFETVPATGALTFAFVVLTFISFVTAMDSNTHSITSVCLKDDTSLEDPAHPLIWVKIFWGALVGAVAWIMTSTTGIDGVRMLSNLGGLPGLFILIGMMGVLFVMKVRLFSEIKAASKAPASSLS